MHRPSARRLTVRAAAVLAVASGLALGGTPARAAEDAHFILVNPGGRGNQSKAQGFLGELASAIDAAWPQGEPRPAGGWHGHYHVTVPDALASVRGSEPVLGFVTPAFLEAYRDELDLTVVARAERGVPRVVHLVAREDDATTRTAVEGGDVAGLRIGGRVAAEPEWTRRRVLGDLGGADDARLVAVERDLAAVRDLQKGKLDLALLDAADWERLAAFGRADGLVSVARSAELPEMAAVAVGAGPAVAAGLDRESLGLAAGRALVALDSTEAGRAVLERMTIERFAAPASPSAATAESPTD